MGKTTLTKKLCSIVTGLGLKTSGFYTEEVRRAGVREGFDVVTLDGLRGCLARDCSRNGPVKFKVGKYGVMVEEFEKVALPSLGQVNTCRIFFSYWYRTVYSIVFMTGMYPFSLMPGAFYCSHITRNKVLFFYFIHLLFITA